MKNILELFLVTYNRKEKCRLTLEAILAESSPIKDFKLTILDNASTDGTSEMLESFAKEHSNIRLIRHSKNIGGNANIARAFEMAMAKYVWVLCDDDKYDFSNWKECEKLLEKNPVAVVVSTYLHPQKGPEWLFRQLSFVPAGIYRTDLITSTTLINGYYNISNLFPHLAIAAAAFNSKENIPILSKPLVTMQLNPGHDSYVRGTSSKEKVHPLMQEMFWSLGYLRTIQMLEDEKIKKACSSLAWAETHNCFYFFCKFWKDLSLKNFFLRYIEALHLLSGKAKWKFLFFTPCTFFLYFYSTDKGLNICLFGFAKIRIWKYKKH